MTRRRTGSYLPFVFVVVFLTHDLDLHNKYFDLMVRPLRGIRVWGGGYFRRVKEVVNTCCDILLKNPVYLPPPHLIFSYCGQRRRPVVWSEITRQMTLYLRRVQWASGTGCDLRRLSLRHWSSTLRTRHRFLLPLSMFYFSRQSCFRELVSCCVLNRQTSLLGVWFQCWPNCWPTRGKWKITKRPTACE